MNARFTFKNTSISLVWFWLLAFALIPFFLMFMTSLLEQGDRELVRLQLTLNNYIAFFNTVYLSILLRSIEISLIVTGVCLMAGYPFAYILARTPERLKNILLLLVIIPFWTSSLVRTYALVVILKAKGLFNNFLLQLGLIHHPLQLLYTNTATIIGLVYTLLPFMILPLYANIEKIDARLLDAARDLGANPWQVFSRILLPLTIPGIIAGGILVFLPAMSLFYISNILGGAKTMLLGNLIENQFLSARNWPMGATISILLTLLMGLMLLLYVKSKKIEPNNSHELL